MCNIDKKKSDSSMSSSDKFSGRSMDKTAVDEWTASLKAKWKFITFKLDTDAPISVVSLRIFKKKRAILIFSKVGTRTNSSYCNNKKYAGFFSKWAVTRVTRLLKKIKSCWTYLKAMSHHSFPNYLNIAELAKKDDLRVLKIVLKLKFQAEIH